MAYLKQPEKSDKLNRLEESYALLEKYYMIQNDIKLTEDQRINELVKINSQLSNMYKINVKTKEEAEALLDALGPQLDIEQKLYETKVKEYKIQQDQLKQKQAEIKLNEQMKKQEKEFQAFSDYITKKTAETDAKLTQKQSFIQKHFNANQSNLEKLQNIRQSVTSDVYNDFAKRGIADKDHYAEMQSQIRSRVDKEVRAAGLGRSADSLVKSANIYASATQAFSNTVDSLKQVFWRFFGEGISNQVSTYNSTFSNVATRSGTTAATYDLKQLGTPQKLLSQGMLDNVRTSDVMSMWNSLANTGMSSENMFATAIDNVVTSKIVPYLDVTTQSFNLLNSKLDNQFIKDIRGINQANLEIAGNNYATQDLLNQIIEEVQPMSDEALENLAQGSTEVTAMINSMIAQHVDPNTAKSYATQLFKSQKYGNQMLQSGSVTDKLFMIDAMASGTNIYDPTQWNDSIALMLSREQQLMSGQSYGNTTSGLYANIVGQAYGIDYGRANAALNPKLNADLLLSNSNKAGSLAGSYSDLVTGKFAKGDYQTTTEKQKTAVENLATGVATLEEKVGEFGTEIVKDIKDIVKILIGDKLTGGIAKAFGLGGGKGLGSLLASGGGLAIGTIGAVAAVGAIATAVASGIADAKQKSAAQNASAYSSKYTAGIGDATSAGAIGSYASDLGRHGNGWSDFWESLPNNAIQTLSNAFNINGYNWDDPANANKEKWTRIIGAQEGAIDKDFMAWMISAYAIAMLDAGNTPDIIPTVLGSGITAEGIKSFMHTYFDKNPESAAKNLNNAMAKLQKLDLYPVGPNRTFSDYSWNLDDMTNWGVYRQGLASVPYDNFPALLHEGEAVLTASTTSALNDLTREYRETKNQSARLDAIVENQTAQLLQKMDEIITVINPLSMNRTAGNYTNTAQQTLRQSMVSLTSNLSFQN